jgi:hypothetical protein
VCVCLVAGRITKLEVALRLYLKWVRPHFIYGFLVVQIKKSQSFGEQRRLEHGLSSDEHQLFYEFLIISPSYLLAHELAIGLSVDEAVIESIPNWEAVMRTYALCGDIFNTPFLKWWESLGRKAFYIQHEDGTYTADGPVQFLVNKVNEQSLVDCLCLVNDKSRIEKTQGKRIENWRLAIESGIKSKWADALKGATKKTFDNLEARTTLGVLVSKKLKEALFISENAARGSFPSINPIDTGLKFNFGTQYDRTREMLSKGFKETRERQADGLYVPKSYYLKKFLPKQRKAERLQAEVEKQLNLRAKKL